MEKRNKEIAIRCKEQIPFYEEKSMIALDYIDRMRCPLDFADETLYNEIQEIIEDYCYEYELDPEDFDAEEIFWIEV